MNSHLQVFTYYFLALLGMLILVGIAGILITKSANRKYNIKLAEIKTNYKSSPDKYLPEIIALAKKQMVNLEFNKFEKDLLPIIKEILPKDHLYEKIENILNSVIPNDTYKTGSSMSSPSDYLDINDKSWKITNILEKILQK